MRRITYTDKHTGYLKVSILRDTDPDELAEQGIPAGPPDVDRIDWNAVKHDINRLMVEQKLMTWEDVMSHPVGLQLFCTVIKKHVSSLYRAKQND